MKLTDKELIDRFTTKISWWEKYEVLLFIIIARAVFIHLPKWVFIIWMATGLLIIVVSWDEHHIKTYYREELKRRKLWG